MNRRQLTALGVLLLPFVGVCGEAHAAESGTCDLFFSGGVSIKSIPVAATVEQRSKGLAGREHAGNGMLFSWGNSEPRAFSMRGVRFPLSVGFLSKDGTLFAIERMEANTDKFYLSMLPASDAIELAVGQFEKVGLVVGFKLIRRECKVSG
ncbi:DUF192 domain-containing protein [Methylomonas sp. ZR1]|uniref:DUF192 domain-containing protein n=1 Tax=Methylomonas sp. ZR1 TaxID=1797072 RepID=UPI0014920246|nr:DUF192 domain-containing protein [Methylomonas sp. ZR1]NOV32715.1 DUF192 domain-containing protein [Methylomonas sp. ZR1]